MNKMLLARLLVLTVLVHAGHRPLSAATLTGRVIDAASGQPIPSRVYIRDANGAWHHPSSVGGTAVRYQKANWLRKDSVEFHTTLSADPFRIDLEPGRYDLTVERGKEYVPFRHRIELGHGALEVTLPLRRWVNMAEHGWYSGDTHVHRTLEELPNVVMAEDLNVAFPLTYWVTRGEVPPTRGDKNIAASASELITVDPTHVIHPRNTEYEIFSMKGKRHTLGALFVLNHKTPLGMGAPPLTPVVRHARAENALLDLDKHNWNWSLVLIPIVQPDLFELSNNHHWRTHFAFTNFAIPAPAFMGIGHGRADEAAWTRYGFQTYYTLLNCGFRLRPSAGTANGVHPVPLGFGRVYVRCPEGFSYEGWIEGLDAGRSFVTTGPMLMTTINRRDTGRRVMLTPGQTRRVVVRGTVINSMPGVLVEILKNGEVVRRIQPEGSSRPEGGWSATFNESFELEETCWLATRAWVTTPEGRVRFAHTAPSYFEMPGRPLRPRREAIQWLIQRVESEIERSRDLLPPSGLAEYENALATYQAIAEQSSEAK